jgi:hypothetical protein
VKPGVTQGCWVPGGINSLPAELENQVSDVRPQDVKRIERKTLYLSIDSNLLFDIEPV